MDGDAAPDPTLSPEQEQEIRAQVREAQQGRRKRGRAEIVAQREQERSAYDPLAQHLGPDLTQMCRELQRLEALLALGYRPVDAATLTPAFTERCAQLASVGNRGDKSPLETLELLLTPELVETAIIGPINLNLKKRRSGVDKRHRWIYNPTDVTEWWCFLGRLLLDRLNKCGKDSGLAANEQAQAKCLVKDKRFSALKQAHRFPAHAQQALQEALRSNLRRVVALGNFATVDETVIAHFGHSMRTEGIGVKIPRKPHPYGLLRYGIVQKLLYSGAPILIDCELRLPAARASGQEAFDRLVRRNFRGEVHVYADSLFGAKIQAANFRRTSVRISISFGDNATDDLVSLRREVVPDLATGSSMTFKLADLVIQITAGDEHPTCVLSSYWRTHTPAPQPPVDMDKYRIARALFDCGASDAALKELLGLDPAANLGSRAEFLSETFGVILWKPLPGPAGLVMTEKNLAELTKPLLVILHNKTPGCSGGSGLTKEQLIEQIMSHNVAALQRPHLSQWQEERRSVSQVRAQVLGLPQHSDTVTARYCENFGLLDRHDRYLYENFGTVHFREWQICSVMSTIFQQVINAHCLFQEQAARRNHPHRGPRIVHADWPTVTSCATYVGAVVRGIIAAQQ